MSSEGNTAWRGVTELKQVLQMYYTVIPERLYIYADGGGDRRITFLRVKMALVAMFLTLDLDELISARSAAGHSFRNPVERCHSIANLGLQGVGMMRQSMKQEYEKIIKSLNSTEEVRRAFHSHPQLEANLEKCLKYSKDLIESSLQKLSSKDKKFTIYEPASQSDISDLQDCLKVPFDENIVDLDKAADIEKFPKFSEFMKSHTQQRTNYF